MRGNVFEKVGGKGLISKAEKKRVWFCSQWIGLEFENFVHFPQMLQRQKDKKRETEKVMEKRPKQIRRNL